MIILNFKSVQKFVFEDCDLVKKLPDLKEFFDAWKHGITRPGCRQMANKSIIDLLNNLKESHLKIISKHLGDEVSIHKIDYNLIKECAVSIDEECLILDENHCYDNFFINRDSTNVTITFWR